MDVVEMSDFEKTMMIINLIPDWQILGHGGDGEAIALRTGSKETVVLRAPNYLFASKWMFLAWRVLNWAHENLGTLEKSNIHNYFSAAWDGPEPKTLHWFYGKKPAAAQRLWLDKVLKLAIKAGLVTAAGFFVWRLV